MVHSYFSIPTSKLRWDLGLWLVFWLQMLMFNSMLSWINKPVTASPLVHKCTVNIFSAQCAVRMCTRSFPHFCAEKFGLCKAVELNLLLFLLFQESESNAELKHKLRHLERQLDSKQNRYHKGIKTAIIWESLAPTTINCLVCIVNSDCYNYLLSIPIL